MKQLTNIVICYANEDEVVEYAGQLSSQSIRNEIKFIVVINKEDKGEDYLRKKLNEKAIEFHIYNPNDNLGYLNGLLYGFLRDKDFSGWYIFSNTDIELPDNEMLAKFLKSDYLKNEDIWVVGPSVYAPYKELYSNPYMFERPSKKGYVIRNVAMSFPYIYDILFQIKSMMRRKPSGNTISAAHESVYAVHGSFFFIHKALAEILCLNKWELLYDEEQYIAETVLRSNKKILYDSKLLVHHMEGSTTSKVGAKERYRKMKKANKRILKEYY